MRHKSSSRSSRHAPLRKNLSHRFKNDSKNGNASHFVQESLLFVWRHHIIRAIAFVTKNWGYILFSLFILMYTTTFWDVAASRPRPHSQKKVIESLRMAIPTNPHLSNQENITVQIHLPGAITNEGKTFENLEGNSREERSSNLLPGAIGLTGAFDEHGDNHTENNNTSTAKTEERAEKKKKETVSATKDGPPGSPSHASSEKGSSSEKKKKKKKKKKAGSKSGKKKKKKKKKKRASDPSEKKESDASTTKAGGAKPREKNLGNNSKGSERSDSSSSNDSSANLIKDKPESGSIDAETPHQSTEKTSKNEKKSETTSKTGSKEPDKSSSSRDETSTKKTKGKKKKGKKEKKKKKAKSAEEPFTVNSTYTGPHPMNRNMEELQVPGDTGILDDSQVRSYYEKLVKAYLAPFGDGIDRRSFFEILRRKTYSLSPPGSNKGIQTILFQLIEKKLYLLDPYEMTKNSKPFYKTRIQELVGLLSEIAKEGNVPNTEFIVAVHDCVQTVNAEHIYRGSVYQESSPTFTIVSCNFSDNIPFPMWEGDPVRGGLQSWDAKMEKYKSSDKTPWEEKQSKAVFRGGNRPSMFYKTKEEADEHANDSGRSRLHFLSSQNPDFFDVGVSGRWGGEMHQMRILSEADHHQYKYILYAEGNCFWADRLNKQIFGPSAILKQETPCGQFWEPLLKPFTHYIPTDFFFQDTIEKIKWAQEHDSEAKAIVKNANDFAASFLTQKAIKTYVEVLLVEYSKLLNSKKIKAEHGSQDVTAG